MIILTALTFLYGATFAQTNTPKPPQGGLAPQSKVEASHSGTPDKAVKPPQKQDKGQKVGDATAGGKNYPDPSWQPKNGQAPDSGKVGQTPKGVLPHHGAKQPGQ